MKRGAKNAETIRRQLESGTLPFVPQGDGIKTCLRCGKKLLQRLTRFSKAARETRTGLCPGCNCWMATQRGIAPGPKGSLINHDVRKENDPHSRWVKCTGPCGRWKFRKIKTWTGVCDSCLKTRFDNEELSNGGWIIRNEKDAEGNRVLYYLYPPKEKGGCGCKREIRPRTATHYAWAAPKGKTPKGKVPLICQPHRLNPFLLLSEQTNGDGQVNGTKQSEHSRGPKPKPAAELLTATKAVILELHEEGFSDREITLPLAVQRLARRDISISEENLRKTINRKKGQTWEEFVKSVLKGCGQISK